MEWASLARACDNRTEHIRYYSKKTIVLSCHRFLINSGVEKWTTFKIDYNLYHQMSLSKGNI